MEDNDSSSEDVPDDSASSGSSKKEKPSANFTKSTKFQMVCHDYILSKCPHQDSKSCKFNHPKVEVLHHILQSALLSSDTKTAQEIERKIDEIKGKIYPISNFFLGGILNCKFYVNCY